MTENAQNADFRRKPQIFADSPLLLEIQAFGGRRKPQKTADFRRKPKIIAENRRKPQIGLCHLRCVTFSSALFKDFEKFSRCGRKARGRFGCCSARNSARKMPGGGGLSGEGGGLNIFLQGRKSHPENITKVKPPAGSGATVDCPYHFVMTLFCGRVLSERALWPLLVKAGVQADVHVESVRTDSNPKAS